MKTFVFVCLTVLAVASAKYTDKYDNINVEEIVTNCRLFVPYMKCCLGDDKRCTKEGRELKSHIVDALENKCSECTERQQEEGKNVMSMIINTQPKAWDLLRGKYDPKNVYFQKYQAEFEDVKKSGKYNHVKECNLETERAVDE